MSVRKYENQIYAGVLGKLLGVYLGRPVEGWSYEKIKKRFGYISDYNNEEVGVPLIVADDDISGTFTFFRALEDYGYNSDITSEQFGKTWLNYIIENQTIFWWGGYGRSTEHTAFLNLKNGISAPKSGSMETNSRAVAEQIGAQIFIDAVAMACPGNPGLAVTLVRNMAKVSHDGIAVEAACHLAALESMAFEEKNISILLDRAVQFIESKELSEVIADVRRVCAQETDWRRVREYLGETYAYEKYPGCCHVIPNHALVIAAVILGGDDFQKSLSVCVSAGWDTDCNAGNVGAFNGIRLGIEAINSGVDLRGPVADFMYKVSADGGAVITDAVQQTSKILQAAAALKGESTDLPNSRFSFAYQGSVQGFQRCKCDTGAKVVISNQNEKKAGENGLRVQFQDADKEHLASIETLTFVDYPNLDGNYTVVASPTLYSSQTVTSVIYTEDEEPVKVKPYILYYDRQDHVQTCCGKEWKITRKQQEYQWRVPDTEGMPIFKFGYQIYGNIKTEGTVIIKEIDWKGAPQEYYQKGLLISDPRKPHPYWIKGFTNSADQFFADFRRTHCIISDEEEGLAVTGTSDWKDYSIEAELYICLHEEAGLVIRSNGQKRYYAAILKDFTRVQIVVVNDGERTVLGEANISYPEDEACVVKLSAKGAAISLKVDKELVLSVEDNTYQSGGAGFFVKKGSMTCNSFKITS